MHAVQVFDQLVDGLLSALLVALPFLLVVCVLVVELEEKFKAHLIRAVQSGLHGRVLLLLFSVQPAFVAIGDQKNRVVSALALEHSLLHELEELDELVGEAALLHNKEHTVDVVVHLAKRKLELFEQVLDVELRIAKADRVDDAELIVVGQGEISHPSGGGVGGRERLLSDAHIVALLVDKAIASG